VANPPSDGHSAPSHELSDQAVSVEVLGQERLASAWKNYDRFRFTFAGNDGTPVTHDREVLRVGRVAAVLPVDPARGTVTLIHQFRYPAQLATGRGELVEIVAGMVEEGEEPAHAAHRECLEEVGVAPRAVIPLFQFMPAPGLVEELAFLYLGLIDSSRVPERAGAADEAEHTRPVSVPIDKALEALASGAIVNGYCVMALQWLALNRNRLDEIARAAVR